MTAESSTDRRDFVRRLIRTTLLAAASTSLGFALWDRKGPGAPNRGIPEVSLPDFANPANQAKLAVTRGFDRSTGVEKVVNALGGMGTFIAPGDRVLLKVNAAFASPPILGATTHPHMVSAVTALCYQAGARQVMVTDNPINDPTAVSN